MDSRTVSYTLVAHAQGIEELRAVRAEIETIAAVRFNFESQVQSIRQIAQEAARGSAEQQAAERSRQKSLDASTASMNKLGMAVTDLTARLASAGSKGSNAVTSGTKAMDSAVRVAAQGMNVLSNSYARGGMTASEFMQKSAPMRSYLAGVTDQFGRFSKEAALAEQTLNRVAAAPVTAAFRQEAAAAREVSQSLNVLRVAWQTEKISGTEAASAMAAHQVTILSTIAALEKEQVALRQKGVLDVADTRRVQELTALQNIYSQALRTTASVQAATNGTILKGSLAASVQAGTAGLNNYKASLFGITSQTELLTNQERAGIITTQQLNLALKEQTASLRTGLAAVDAEVMGLKALGVLSVQETERLAQLTQSQNSYTAALARTLEAQQRSNAMGARAGFAQGAGLRGNISGLGMAASLVSPEAGMLAMAASFPPVVAGAAAAGLAVAGVVKLTKDGQDEVKKLQQAYLSLKVNGVHDIGEVDKALDHMIATGSTSDRMFSKSELAEGLALMSRSGFKGAEGLTALATATRLAASENIPLDDAVKRLASNLQHLEMTGNDAASFGDKLVQASHLTQDSADAFSKGMNVIGFTAKTLGFSVNETMGMLVALSVKGLDPATIGSTGLRNAMQKVESGGDRMGRIMSALGVDLKDASGHARTGRDVFTDLLKVVSSTAPIYNRNTGMLMTANDRAALNFELFGTRSATAFIGVQHGAKEASDKIANSAGFAVHSSDEMASGYEGAQKRMTAATKDLSRAFAETFTPTLTAATVKTTEFIRWLGDLGQRANDAKPYLEGLAIVLTAVGLKALAATGFVRELLLAQSIGGIANVVTVASTAIQLKMLPALTGLTAGATGAAGALKLLTTLGPLLLLSAAAGLGIYVNTILDNIHKIQDEVAKTEADVEKQQEKMWNRGREGQLEKQRLDLVQADTTGLSAEVLKHRQDDIAKIGQELAAIRAAQKALPAPVATGAPVAGSSALEAGLNLRQARTGTPFGQKYFGNQIHNGEDLFAPVDTPVTAPFAGFATTRWSKTTGHIIELIDATGQKLLLGHLNGYADGLENAIKAAGGKLLVKQGQLVGYVGQTGSLAHADLGPGNSHTHVMGYDAQGKVVSPFSLKYQGVTDGMNTGAPPNIDPKFAAQVAGWKKQGETLYAAFKSGHYDVAALKTFQKAHKGIWDQIVADAKGAAKDLKTTGLSDADWAKYGQRATQLAQMQVDINSGKITGAAGRHDQNTIDSFNSDPVKSKALAYASKQLTDAKRLSDESNRIATEQANFTKTLNRQTSDTAISTAQANLKSLEANRDAALQSSKKDAASQLQVEQQKGAAILNVQRNILRQQRDQAIQTAHDTATRSRTDAEALYGKGKTPQARLDEISALESRQVKTANTNYITDSGTAQAQQDRRIIEAKARVQADADRDDKAQKAAKDAQEKARQQVVQQAREQDVKSAQLSFGRLKQLRDAELRDAGDNVTKKLAIQKRYASDLQHSQEEIALAQLRIDKAEANSGPVQNKAKGISNAYATYYQSLSDAKNPEAVTQATEAQTSAVQKQRDAYHALAESLRGHIQAGDLDAKTQQDLTHQFNLLGAETAKLGLTNDPFVKGARAATYALVDQGQAAYLTAQRTQGMISGNADAADSVLSLAEELQGLGDQQGAVAALQTEYSSLMDSLARGETTAEDVNKVATALERARAALAGTTEFNQFVEGLAGSLQDKMGQIADKILDPSTSNRLRGKLKDFLVQFSQDASNTILDNIRTANTEAGDQVTADSEAGTSGIDSANHDFVSALFKGPDVASKATSFLSGPDGLFGARFWSQLGEQGRAEFTASLSQLAPADFKGMSSATLKGLIESIGDDPDWAELKKTVQSGLTANAAEAAKATNFGDIGALIGRGQGAVDDLTSGKTTAAQYAQIITTDLIPALELISSTTSDTDVKAMADKAIEGLKNEGAEAQKLADLLVQVKLAKLDADKASGNVSERDYINTRQTTLTDQENAGYSETGLTGNALLVHQKEHEAKLTQISTEGDKARADLALRLQTQTLATQNQRDADSLSFQHAAHLVSDADFQRLQEAQQVTGAQSAFNLKTQFMKRDSEEYRVEAAQLEADLTKIRNQGILDRAALDSGQVLLDNQKKALTDLKQSYQQGAMGAVDMQAQAIGLAQSLDEQAKAAERAGRADLAAQFREAAAQARALAGPLGVLAEKMNKWTEYLQLAGEVTGAFGKLTGAMAESEQDYDETGKKLSTPWKDLTANINGAQKAIELAGSIAGDVAKIFASGGTDLGSWAHLAVSVIGSIADALGGYKKAQAEVISKQKEFNAQFTLINGDDYAKTYTRSKGFFADLFGGGPEVVQEIDQVGLKYAKTLESSIVGGIDSGMKEALAKNDFSLFEKSLRSSIYDGTVQGLLDAFKSDVIKGILGPAIKEWSDALKTPGTEDDDLALSHLDSAIGEANAAGQQFYNSVAPRLAKLNPASDDTTTSTDTSSSFGAVATAGQVAVGSDMFDAVQLLDGVYRRADAMYLRLEPRLDAFGAALDQFVKEGVPVKVDVATSDGQQGTSTSKLGKNLR